MPITALSSPPSMASIRSGLVLIGASLLMDAFTGGLQDKVKKRTAELNPDAGEKPVPTMHESMFWTNCSQPMLCG